MVYGIHTVPLMRLDYYGPHTNKYFALNLIIREQDMVLTKEVSKYQ